MRDQRKLNNHHAFYSRAHTTLHEEHGGRCNALKWTSSCANPGHQMEVPALSTPDSVLCHRRFHGPKAPEVKICCSPHWHLFRNPVLTTDYDTSKFRKVPGLSKSDWRISKEKSISGLSHRTWGKATRQGISESCPVMWKGLSSGQSLTMWSGYKWLLH